jgi:hypothetical protein
MIDKGLFLGEKTDRKSRHNLRGKSQMLPYLDNEFLLVARIGQESPPKNLLKLLKFHENFMKIRQ